MDSLEELRDLHNRCSPSCITTRCRAEGVTLTLPGQGAVCISCDACTCFPKGQGDRRPDFVVLHCPREAPRPRWFIIEMKKKVSDTDRIVSQIQAGVDVVQNSPCFKVTDRPGKLVLIIVHGRGVKDSELLRKRINLLGKRYEVFFKRSGSDLV